MHVKLVQLIAWVFSLYNFTSLNSNVLNNLNTKQHQLGEGWCRLRACETKVTTRANIKRSNVVTQTSKCPCGHSTSLLAQMWKTILSFDHILFAGVTFCVMPVFMRDGRLCCDRSCLLPRFSECGWSCRVRRASSPASRCNPSSTPAPLAPSPRRTLQMLSESCPDTAATTRDSRVRLVPFSCLSRLRFPPSVALPMSPHPAHLHPRATFHACLLTMHGVLWPLPASGKAEVFHFLDKNRWLYWSDRWMGD